MAAGGGAGYMMEDVNSIMEATCGDLFDHIEDLLDFPKEDAADVLLLDAPVPNSPLCARIIDNGNGNGNGHGNGIIGAAPSVEPLLLPLNQDDAFFNAAHSDNGSASMHISVGPPMFDSKDDQIGPCDDLDMAQLEWLSNLFDDTAIPHDPYPIKNPALAANAVVPNKEEEEPLFRSSSPISVLERNSFNIVNAGAGGGASSLSPSSSSSASSSYSSSDTFSGSSRASSSPVSPGPPAPVLVIPARARSKRSRPSAFTSRTPAAAAPFAPPPADAIVPVGPMSCTSSHSDPESIAESNPHPPPMKKKKKAKKPPSELADDEDGMQRPQQGAVRRCMHCQIEKTPQWRAGPMGPKTLCNACGVRYKSGRLFPEYRPAASPTFVPSIHSNSHKKVVEMRLKAATSGDPSCDLLQFIRRKD